MPIHRFASLTFVVLFFCKTLSAHILADSATVLTLPDFLKIVQQQHPVARQAAWLQSTAQAQLLAAKGGFDPKIMGNWEQKKFDEKTYFNTSEIGVKLPTWYGIELKGTYNTASGTFLNPEEKLPPRGQAVLGASFSLLQGLMIDDRRAALAKAKQMQGASQTERADLVNELLFEAAQAYWKWALAAQQNTVVRQMTDVAKVRFQAIKQTVAQGDRMALDTLEALIAVQERTLQLNETDIDLQMARFKLSNFLWKNETEPFLLAPNILPDPLEQIPLFPISDTQREALVNRITEQHPALQNYRFKLAQLDIDRRLKAEKFKPKLNFNYNFLGNSWDVLNVPFANNYKWGVSFSTPSLLLRSERGEWQETKIKIEVVESQRLQKTLELTNKLRAAVAETNNLTLQIRLSEQTVANYSALVRGENRRFELGESSLFLINAREMKFLEAQLKLTKLRASFQTARVALDWAGGRLGNQ